MFNLFKLFTCYAPDEGLGGGGAPGIESPAGGVTTDPGTTPNVSAGEGTPPVSGEPAATAEPAGIDWSKVNPDEIPDEVAEQLALKKGPSWYGKRIGQVTAKQTESIRTELQQAKARIAELEGGKSAPATPTQEIDPAIASLPQSMQKMATELKALGQNISEYDPDEELVNIGTVDRPRWKDAEDIALMRNVAENTARSILDSQRQSDSKAQSEQAQTARATELLSGIETCVSEQVKELFKGINESTVKGHQDRMLKDAIELIAGHIQTTGDIDPETMNGMIADSAKSYTDSIFAINREQVAINAKAQETALIGSKGAAAAPGPVDESKLSRSERRALVADRTRQAEAMSKR